MTKHDDPGMAANAIGADGETAPDSPVPGRRRWLAGAGALGLLAAGTARGQAAGKGPSGAGAQADGLGSARVTGVPSSEAGPSQRHPFFGPHQQGILTPRPAAGMVAAFDVLATTPEALAGMFRTLTERIAFLTQGGKAQEADPGFPPPDSGILGPVIAPDALTITVSVGASLFDERFGLASARPRRLSRMTRFPNDALDASLCHGDLLLQCCANTPDTLIHALRDIVKNLPGALMLRWKQEGSVPVRKIEPGQPPENARNFLGFRDGSANPDAGDAALMDQLVWVRGGGGEPAWAAGGTYQAVRLIRNFVERWDRTPLREQEHIFGRRKASGAPLDGRAEADVPDYSRDPDGAVTPMDAHIRLANPRTPHATATRILRRPFNYSNGVTRSGQLDMGLIFIAYQADLEQGFIAVQKRLDGEPLEEYIKPVGGGYFFVLPGARDERDFLGRGLLATLQA